MSMLVKTMDEYHEWHRSYIESLQCCINYLSSAKDELSGSMKSSLTSTMCRMKTLNVSLHKRISSPHTGRGLYDRGGARASTLRWENVESAFKSRISTGIVINVEHIDPKQFLQHAKRMVTGRVTEFLNVHSSLKASVTLEAEFMQHTNEVSVKSFGTRNVALFRTSNLRQWYQRDVVPTILTSLEEFQERDSGWALSKILHLIVNFSKYQPLQAGCTTETYLPRTIQLKKTVVNVNNKDEACFFWAVVVGLYPAKTNPSRLSSYPHYKTVLQTEGFQSPMLFKDIRKFERKNDVSINVFEWVRKKCVTLHLTEKKRTRHVNLLFIQNAAKTHGHFACIRNLSRLVSSQLSKHKCTKHICDRCLQYFPTLERLNIHTIDCERMNDCALTLPTSEDKWLHFKNFVNKEQTPFIIYVDLECLLLPEEQEGEDRAARVQYQQHHAFSIGYYIHCRYDESVCEYQVYRDKAGCAAWFANRLYELSQKLQPLFDKTVPMNPLTEAEKLNFRIATHCHVCEKTFEENDIRFLNSSLDKLSSYLDKNKLRIVQGEFTHLSNDDFNLLTRKGVFPYDYLASYDKLNDTCLPPREAFYNRLKGSEISDVDYLHANTVWSRFTIQTLGEYSDLYLKLDVLLLADVFENFRDDCLENYKLDPAHYFTLPGFAWDVMLKMTKIELELFTDVDMLLFVERGIRGGLSQCSHRYAYANNKYLSTHDSSKPSTYLMYFDVNNLYGWAMSQPLPHRDFRWVEDIDNFNIESIPIDSPVGYILEVDLEYPREIHDAHADLPFCPSHDAATSSSQRKLLATLRNKERYVIHYRYLQQSLKHNLKLKKIHRILEFQQSRWLHEYIDLNTKLRTNATNDFSKNLHGVERLIARPNFHSYTVFSKDFVAIQMKKLLVKFYKPIYVGMSILDISKFHLYTFHYEYMYPKFQQNCKILYTDTDSLIYEITCDDAYETLLKRDIHRYDTSNYTVNNVYGVPIANKKQLGLMKDENGGKIMTEFVGLCSKMYAIRVHDDCETKKIKGIRTNVTARDISFEDYVECLNNHTEKSVSSNCIASVRHQVYSMSEIKLALSPKIDVETPTHANAKSSPLAIPFLVFTNTKPRQPTRKS
ncbi:uncharacterized protein LOC143221926 [Lasioglossum baleicum]|uniref:uncharacterized protein LOC143221926 n=1 Tax=Lasioglossum baleicum TaxID=434251 RepID=UPI003FCE2D2E